MASLYHHDTTGPRSDMAHGASLVGVSDGGRNGIDPLPTARMTSRSQAHHPVARESRREQAVQQRVRVIPGNRIRPGRDGSST